MTVTLRRTFDEKLHRLQDEVLLLGSMVERALIESVDALLEWDLAKTSELLATDDAFRRKRSFIEAEALALIATQHPVARDLRALAAMLEVSSELERMGWYTEEICKLNLGIGASPVPRSLYGIPAMAQIAQEMLHRALSALVKRDLNLARSVPADDDRVDALYEQMNTMLPSLSGSSYSWDQSLQLLRVAHNLERLADRVINICEWVVYIETGELLELG
jgi:phosphate transport system protein